MRFLNKLLIIFFLFFLFFTLSLSQVFGQDKSSSTTQTKLLTIAREIIAEAGNAALITLDSQGRPRTRAMDPFTPEEDFTIWFGTNIKSRKVAEIRRDPRVILYYFDKPSASYVTITGRAEVIETINAKTSYWKKEWAAFYPDYPQGYALIKVTPDWLEVISESRGITGDSLTWLPPRVQFNSKN